MNEAASRLAQLGACARSAEIEIGFHPSVSTEIGPRLEHICAEAQELVTLLARAQAALADAEGADPTPAASEPVAPPVVPPEPEPAPAPSRRGPYSFAARSNSNGDGVRCSPAAIRLFATQLAEAGASRDEIEGRLRVEFGIPCPADVIPDLLAKVAN